jgi:hypothetical protein
MRAVANYIKQDHRVLGCFFPSPSTPMNGLLVGYVYNSHVASDFLYLPIEKVFECAYDRGRVLIDN